MKQIQTYLFTLVCFLSLTLSGSGQEKIRQIEKKTTKNEPIQLVSSEIGNKIVNFGSQTLGSVLANKDWLNSLKLNLKNISNRKIVYVEIELEIEATGKMKYPLRVPLKFGELPMSDNANNESPRILQPNESVKIFLKPSTLNSLTQFLQGNEVNDVQRIKIHFEVVVFEDGTGWSKGQQIRQNPNDGKKWEIVGNYQENSGFFLTFLNLIRLQCS